MNREQWVREASTGTGMSERQAEALYRRQNGEGRKEAAEAMGITPSNLDNAEREARTKIMRASNLIVLAAVINADPDDQPIDIGTCAECDKPKSSLRPHPYDDGPLENRRLACSSCREELVSDTLAKSGGSE